MNKIYMVSFTKFKEETLEITAYAYIFKSAEESIKFRDLIKGMENLTVSIQNIFENSESAFQNLQKDLNNGR